MSRLDGMLCGVAETVDLQPQMDRVWANIMRRRMARLRAIKIASSAAALVCAFTAGWLASTSQQDAPPIPAENEIAIPAPDEIAIPKTDGIAAPGEVEIAIPTTDAAPILEYMEDAELSFIPNGYRIDDFLPTWTPDGVSSPWIDSPTSWHCEGEIGQWIRGELCGGEQLQYGLIDVGGLESGYMRGCVMYSEDAGGLAEGRIAARMDGGKYLVLSFSGILYSDGVKVLESIGCEQ